MSLVRWQVAWLPMITVTFNLLRNLSQLIIWPWICGSFTKYTLDDYIPSKLINRSSGLVRQPQECSYWFWQDNRLLFLQENKKYLGHVPITGACIKLYTDMIQDTKKYWLDLNFQVESNWTLHRRARIQHLWMFGPC